MSTAFGNSLIVAVYPWNATETVMRSCVITLAEHKSTQLLSFRATHSSISLTPLNPCLNCPFKLTPKSLCAFFDLMYLRV